MSRDCQCSRKKPIFGERLITGQYVSIADVLDMSYAIAGNGRPFLTIIEIADKTMKRTLMKTLADRTSSAVPRQAQIEDALLLAVSGLRHPIADPVDLQAVGMRETKHGVLSRR